MITPDQIALMIAEMVRDKATKQGRIPFDTGDLRKSIYTELIGTGMAAVGSNLSYARAVHDGRKALTIRPNVQKNPPLGDRKHQDMKKARLKFQLGGKTVFARQVFQPARVGRPFLQEAIDEVAGTGYDFLMPRLIKDLGDELAKALRGNLKVTFDLRL